MREELLKVANKIDKINKKDNWYNSSYSFMRDFIYKKLSSPFKEKNATELIDNLDIILKYTGLNNMNYLLDNLICRQPNFIDKLASNLKYFKYSNHLGEILQLITHPLGDDIFCDKIFDSIAEFSYRYFAMKI